MTVEELFCLLSSKNGAYSLPYLITLTDGTTTLNYVNSAYDITYDDTVYKSEVFQFTPNAYSYGFSGGGTLEIARTFDIVSLLENNSTITIKIVGVLYNGEVSALTNFESSYCTATFDKSTVKITMEKDDRLSMTFPATVFNSANNSTGS